MSFIPTFDIGDLIKFIGFVLTGIFFVWKLSGRLDVLSQKMSGRFDLFNVEITALKDIAKTQSSQLAEFSRTLVEVARQDERINAIESRVEDLRRGRGWIQRDIDGEYAKTGKRPL